ncbi:MAG: hypothetical protein GYB33_03860 [Gammaproteobacteria bacterium]|nr:hypothetical protein [Gammaproteobacteria bacterium]
MPNRHLLLSLSLSAVMLLGCEQEPAAPPPDSRATAATDDGALQASTLHAWQRFLPLARKSLDSLEQLNQQAAELVRAPAAETLAAARDSWHRVHRQLLSLAPLFSLSAANPELLQQLRSQHFELDGWPITPGYLDSFDVYVHSGIVNDISIPINAEAIRAQHWLTDTEDIVLGLHAIAYLLWGENQQRSAADFTPQTLSPIQEQNGLSAVDLPNQRRAALLQLQITLLNDDLSQLVYRLEQSASSLNSSYDSLAAPVQLELWRGGLQQLLQRLQQRDLAKPEEPTEEWHYHNEFAGQTAATLALELESVRQLLSEQATGQQPLGYWLLAEGQSDSAVQQLDSAIALLRGYSDPWAQLPHELAAQLQEQLQTLRLLLQ